MTCAATDRILQTIKINVPGVTDPVIELQLFNIMDEFLRRTSAWQQEIPIELVEGQRDYPVPTPPSATMVRVMWARHNNMPVTPAGVTGITQSSLGTLDYSELLPDGDAIIPFDTSDIDQNDLFTWAIYRPNYITVTGVTGPPQTAYPLMAQIVLSVSRSCLEADCGDWDVPEWMWEMYFQEWLDGTQARLFGMKSKPWTDTTLAQYHAKRFRNQMGYRKQEVPKGFTWGQPGWRFPRGGWT